MPSLCPLPFLPRVACAAATVLLAAGCGSAVTSTEVVLSTSSDSAAASGPATGSAPAAPDPCSGVSFGAPLAPLNPPAQIHAYTRAPAMTIRTDHLYEATIATAKGQIVLCLQPALAPVTVNNFVTLARNHFFDGLTFHRVVPGFVIQGGDPAGDGSGGPGYQFRDEPVKGQYQRGTVAMANAGPDTNGSQFFICIGDGAHCGALQPQAGQAAYNLFGSVAKGQDVAERIAQGDATTTITVSEQA